VTEDCKRYLEFAEHHLRKGELEKAADSYELALRFDAHSLVALCGLANVCLRKGELTEARRVLGRALQLGEEHPEVLKIQAELHARSGRFDLAVRSIRQAADSDTDSRRFRGR
jgi:Flp pilus assembly protein TadD